MKKCNLPLAGIIFMLLFLSGCASTYTPSNTVEIRGDNTYLHSKPEAEELADILIQSNISYDGGIGFYHICNNVGYNFIQENKEYLIFYFSCTVDRTGDSRSIILNKEDGKWKILKEFKEENIPPEVFEGAESIDLDKSLILDYGKERCFFYDSKIKRYSDISELSSEVEKLEREINNFEQNYRNITCFIQSQIGSNTYEVIIPWNKNSYDLAILITYSHKFDRIGYANIWVTYMYDEYDVKLQNGFLITAPVFLGFTYDDIVSLKAKKIEEFNTKSIELEQIKAENSALLLDEYSKMISQQL